MQKAEENKNQKREQSILRTEKFDPIMIPYCAFLSIFIMPIVTNMEKYALYNFFHKLEFIPCMGEQPPQNMEKQKLEKKDEKHKRALKRKNSKKKGAF